MATDNDDDLFNEEFDLVDDNEYDVEDDHDEVDDHESDAGNSGDNDANAKAPAESDAVAAKAGRNRKRKTSTANEDPVPGPASDAEGKAPASDAEGKAPASDEDLDEYGRPKPEPNYVVHIYEYQKFKRTLDRPFTPEDAEAFATEYNRTGKRYSRFALAGKNDVKPKKAPQL
jgi:hypothetical protein